MTDNCKRKRVLLLHFGHSAIKGMTHEVREDGLIGFALFLGPRKECLQWIADHHAECVNLHLWGDQLPAPQRLPVGGS
ncbi:Putative 3-oxoacyl-[acyl-carrier-protein] reductase (plasmid) [Mesorhizobium loti]|nr:Putative 3-oxoacyl-[acyl-carrier-protein] reductase [Mesorhizobium loti]BCH05104.1 hypothetical protein MesoLj131b_71030 [Mesorhizobium sp. 131-2-5]